MNPRGGTAGTGRRGIQRVVLFDARRGKGGNAMQRNIQQHFQFDLQPIHRRRWSNPIILWHDPLGQTSEQTKGEINARFQPQTRGRQREAMAQIMGPKQGPLEDLLVADAIEKWDFSVAQYEDSQEDG